MCKIYHPNYLAHELPSFSFSSSSDWATFTCEVRGMAWWRFLAGASGHECCMQQQLPPLMLPTATHPSGACSLKVRSWVSWFEIGHLLTFYVHHLMLKESLKFWWLKLVSGWLTTLPPGGFIDPALTTLVSACFSESGMEWCNGEHEKGFAQKIIVESVKQTCLIG